MPEIVGYGETGGRQARAQSFEDCRAIAGRHDAASRGQRYPLEETPGALEAIAQRKAVGKWVVVP